MSGPAAANQPHIPCKPKVWSYGITTVPSRADSLLPRTLASLAKAGFDKPKLFVDDDGSWKTQANYPNETVHRPPLLTQGNWLTGAIELFTREAHADLFAMFQDDLVAVRGLRAYLESCSYPAKGYWNLYTFPNNQGRCPPNHQGWFLSDQLGKGAVGLVFDREALLTLLTSRSMVERPLSARRGHRAVDGGIVTAMKKAGYQEWCHNPSLLQHTGDRSVMGNAPHARAVSFPGEETDIAEILARKGIPLQG